MPLSRDDLYYSLGAAIAPSRRLDGELALSVGWTVRNAGSAGRVWLPPNSSHAVGSQPRYTFSVDDALLLLPPGWLWHGGTSHGRAWARMFPLAGQQEGTSNQDAVNVATAISRCRLQFDGGHLGERAFSA